MCNLESYISMCRLWHRGKLSAQMWLAWCFPACKVIKFQQVSISDAWSLCRLARHIATWIVCCSELLTNWKNGWEFILYGIQTSIDTQFSAYQCLATIGFRLNRFGSKWFRLVWALPNWAQTGLETSSNASNQTAKLFSGLFLGLSRILPDS